MSMMEKRGKKGKVDAPFEPQVAMIKGALFLLSSSIQISPT
jgi:hypothetical protein